jgi:hypothetical protein
METKDTTLQQPLPQPIEDSSSVQELWRVNLQPAGCPQCRQSFLVQATRIGQVCSHCGKGRLEAQPALLRKEPAELMVGFQKGKTDLPPIFSGFVKGVWLHNDDFNPMDLARRAIPVYWPMWLVDCDLSGDWLAEVGYDYQVKSSRESYREARWQTHEIIENRIRWEPRAGQINRHYDNLAAPALSHQSELLQNIQNYRSETAAPYKPEWLGQADLWMPDIHPENSWPLAQSGLDLKASEDCQKAAGGTHVRSFTIHSRSDNINWTQLLLPIYVSFYTDDAGQPRLVYVNGQSGAAGGLRLASQRKGWQSASILAIVAAALFILGMLGLAATAVLPPAGALGILFVFLAFVLGIAAIVPAAWPWQWNRGQQEQKVTRT